MFVYKKNFGFKSLNNEIETISSAVEKLKLPSGFIQFILYILSELAANISEHSKAKNVFIKIDLKNKNCTFEINDNGIGLKQSYIQKKIYPKDDFAAIEFALNGLSTKNLNERGFGLYSIRKLSTGLKGKMTISSDKAKIVLNKDNMNFQQLKTHQKGVSVIIQTKIIPISCDDFYKFIE